MAKLFFVGALCLATLACLARAADPIEAEIGNLKEELFDNPESRLTVDETLERLTRLESLVAPRADQHEQLLRDVRELVGYSNITDEKCRGGASLGRMFDVSAYTDAPSHTIAPYWAHQATRQLEHCRDILNRICEKLRKQDLEDLIKLLTSIKKEQDKAGLDSEAQTTAMAKGFAQYVIEGDPSTVLPKSEDNFNRTFGRVKATVNYVMREIRESVRIFLAYEPTHGIRFHDARALILARGSEFQRSMERVKTEALKNYIPKSFADQLKEMLLGTGGVIKNKPRFLSEP